MGRMAQCRIRSSRVRWDRTAHDGPVERPDRLDKKRIAWTATSGWSAGDGWASSTAKVGKNMRLARIPITMVVALLAAVTFVVIAPGRGRHCRTRAGARSRSARSRPRPATQLTVTASGYPGRRQVTFTLSDPGTVAATQSARPVTARHGHRGCHGRHPGLHAAGRHRRRACTSSPPSGVPPVTAIRWSAPTSWSMRPRSRRPPPPPTGTGTLPRTGTNSAELLQLALVLIAVGGLITLATRKRCASEPPVDS